MAKYIWSNTNLKKQSNKYGNIMLVFMAATLLMLWCLPENLKVINFIPLVGALVCFIQQWRIQNADKRLKAETTRPQKKL